MPQIIYSCPKGAQGPSGLLLICLDQNESYVANMNFLSDERYKKLIEELVLTFPEIAPFAPLKIDKACYRERVKNYYELVYLGLGNEAYIDSSTSKEIERITNEKIDGYISFDIFTEILLKLFNTKGENLYSSFQANPFEAK